jgi:LPXTG-motif cell wall-anchored protein
MSRLTVRTTGVIFAVVALVLGLSAGSAVGWYDQPSQPKEEHEKDKDHDKDEDKGGKHEEKPPEVTVPPAAVTPPPPAVTPPAAVTPPPPVVSQGAPPAPAPEQPVGAETTPTVRGEEKVGPTVAQAPSQPAIAPAAEREELAKTGIDPGLIALFGAVCLIGGGLLFRRAFARG